jgi:hypothetical protein
MAQVSETLAMYLPQRMLCCVSRSEVLRRVAGWKIHCQAFVKLLTLHNNERDTAEFTVWATDHNMGQ